MKQEILEYIQQYRGVTFVELEKLLGDAVKGEGLLVMTDYPNIVLWDCVNEEFIATIRELLTEKKIVAKPTVLLTYLIDGKMLRLPIAKKCYPYKTLRWLPIVFNPAELCS